MRLRLHRRRLLLRHDPHRLGRAIPAPTRADLYDVVLESQAAGKDAVAIAADCAEVDRASCDVIDAAGLGETFIHGTGHGVGLDIHEAPRVVVECP